MTSAIHPSVFFAAQKKKTSPKQPAQKPEAKNLDQATVTHAVNQASQAFSVSMLRELKDKAVKDNLVFSPLSVWNALMLLLNGAEGNTRTEIQKALQLDKISEKGASLEQITQANRDAMEALKKITKIDLRNAYAIWARNGSEFTETYLERIKALSADVGNFAPGDPAPINAWADKNTNGMIKKVLTPDEVRDAMAVLTNAIYMKAPWVLPFKKEATLAAEFNGAEKVTRPSMMKMSDQRFKYMETDDAQVLNMPYGEKQDPNKSAVNQLSMTVFLPKQQKGLSALYERLMDDSKGKEPALYTEVKQILQSVNKPKVILSFPRFKNQIETPLNPVLKAVGLGGIFSNTADFTKMMKKETLKVDKAKQNAAIDVTEEGTEAAAVTTISMVRATSIRVPEPKVVFNADHPFVYAIHDNNGQVLFVGTVNNLDNAK